MPQQTIDGTGNGSLLLCSPRLVLGWQSTSHRPPLPPPQSSVWIVMSRCMPPTSPDVHPGVGNERRWPAHLGPDPSWFGDYRGIALGVAGKTAISSRSALLTRGGARRTRPAVRPDRSRRPGASSAGRSRDRERRRYGLRPHAKRDATRLSQEREPPTPTSTRWMG